MTMEFGQAGRGQAEVGARLRHGFLVCFPVSRVPERRKLLVNCGWGSDGCGELRITLNRTGTCIFRHLASN